MISSFFRGFVGNFTSKDRFQQIFDPQYEVPNQISDLIEHSPRETVDENSGWEYLDMSHYSISGVLDITDIIEEVDTVDDYPNSERKLTKIEWDTSAGVSVSPYLDVVLSNRSGGGLGTLDNKILTFSVALGQFCDIDPTSRDVTHLTDINDFGIELLYDDGTTSTSDTDPAAAGIQPPTLGYYDIMTDDSPNPMAKCNPNFDGLTPLSCMNPGANDSSLCLAALGSATTSKAYFAFNTCRRVEESNAPLESSANQTNSLLTIGRRSIAEAEPHAPQTELGDFQTIASQGSLFHFLVPFQFVEAVFELAPRKTYIRFTLRPIGIPGRFMPIPINAHRSFGRCGFRRSLFNVAPSEARSLVWAGTA